MRTCKLIKKNTPSNIEEIKDDVVIPLNIKDSVITKLNSGSLGVTRTTGSFKDVGIWLDKNYNWELIKDEDGCLVLICLKK